MHGEGDGEGVGQELWAEWASIRLRFIVCVCIVATSSCESKIENRKREREEIPPEKANPGSSRLFRQGLYLIPWGCREGKRLDLIKYRVFHIS